MPKQPWFFAETVGTFILVFGGLSAVAGAVTLGQFVDLFSVAAVWGLSLTAAIYLCGTASGAHFNPAITVGFALRGDIPRSVIPGYFAAQLLGAFLAGAAVFALFGQFIEAYEMEQGIRRGAPGSEATAMLFGEYFPNPQGAPLPVDANAPAMHLRAFFAELLGTALLALAIFGLTDKRNLTAPGNTLIAPAIGATLTALICIFAPISMAGFNPARDFGPRLFSALAGWGSWSFRANDLGWLSVYIIAPFLGSVLGLWLSSKLFEKHSSKSPLAASKAE